MNDITHPHNYTLLNQCLFHEESNSLTNDIIDYRWFILAEFLFAASDMMLVIGLGLCVMFNYGLLQVFRAKLHVWESNTTFNCGFWYLLTKIIPIAMAAFTIVLSIKYHKKRKMEEVLPSEHIFAEQYYSVE